MQNNNFTNVLVKNPDVSGGYLCTCITIQPVKDGVQYVRYPYIMHYDIKRDKWHDVGGPYGISHRVAAWKNLDVYSGDIDYDTLRQYMGF